MHYVDYSISNKRRRTLTKEQVLDIRKRAAAGDRPKDIYRDYCISSGSYWKIIHRQTYREF